MTRFSLRARLASVMGLMLVICGAALLAISYGLVSSNLSAPGPTKLGPAIRIPATGSPHVVRAIEPDTRHAAHATAAVDRKGAEQNALRQHDSTRSSSL